MTTPAELDELLTSLGYPASDSRLDLSRFGYYQTTEDYNSSWGEEYRLFEPLSQRSWLLHFDAEGNFFDKGEHRKLVEALLTIVGIEPLPEVRDTFISQEGWIFEILDDDRPRAYKSEQDRDLPSDYAEIPLVIALVNDYLDGEYRVVSMNTDDQSAALACMPREVYDELVDRDWLSKSRSWRPSPEQLLTERLGDRLPSGVRRLEPNEAQARVAAAPDDWFADY